MKRNFDVNNFISKLQQNCKLSIVKEFEADEIITTFLLRRNQFCILVEGEAQLITYDNGVISRMEKRRTEYKQYDESLKTIDYLKA